MLDVYSSTWTSLPGTKKATLLRTHSQMHILHPLGQRHHTFHRCCMVLNWPQPSQFPLSRSPGPALERSSSAESRKVKMEEAWKYVSVCIAARVTLFTLSLHCCRLARLLTRAFNSYASVVAVVVACQPSFYTCWTTIFGFFWGAGIAGFCRHIACLGLQRSFVLQDPLNVYLVANDFSTKNFP